MSRATKGTRTLTIAALSAKLKSADTFATVVDTPYASEFEVEVAYTFQPGLPNYTEGAMEDADPGLDEELRIISVRATANVEFEGNNGYSVTAKRGTDLRDLFSTHEIGELEDRISAEIKNERGER